MWFVGEENVMGRKKIVDVGWEEIGADMDRVDGELRRKEEDRRVREAVEKRRIIERSEKGRLTAEVAVKLFNYDRETGVVTMKIDYDSRKAGDPASRSSAGKRRRVTVGAYEYDEHRIAILLVTGKWPNPDARVKHINGDNSDNRWDNLQVVEPEKEFDWDEVKTSKTVVKEIRFVRGTKKYRLAMEIDGVMRLIGDFDEFRQAFLRKNEIDKNKGV
jgi:hypothetical protein